MPGYGVPPFGGGGSFLGTAASAAAGVVGGALLLDGIRSMFGHHGGHGPVSFLVPLSRPAADAKTRNLVRKDGSLALSIAEAPTPMDHAEPMSAMHASTAGSGARIVSVALELH